MFELTLNPEICSMEVTPVFFDQFGNAELVNKQGNGVGMMKGLNSITAEELADVARYVKTLAGMES